MPQGRHLLGIAQLTREDVLALLDAAERWLAMPREEVRNARVLLGRTIVNLFFESSTRTRASFEVAGKRLGADVVQVSPQTSSVTKGETLLDTVRNLESLRADAIVIRHAASGAPHFVARYTDASIVNAGDGSHEHPTQALLDALTIRRSKRASFGGLVIAICGDILHSRVARSNALLLGMLGAEVRLCGPRTLMPREVESLGPTVRGVARIEDAVAGADVVMMLRIQTERLANAMLASTREYARTFGLSQRVLALAKGDAIVMHPGPINRGVELDPRIADGDRSVILQQVEAGVAVRMAVLESVVRAGDDARATQRAAG
jgi:aspartate carbamoyltransferase catalytic subunit